jgi:hypothetical protein
LLQTACLIPVFDYLKYIKDQFAHAEKMKRLKQIIQLIGNIKKVEEDIKLFFRRIYAVISQNELIDAKDLLWQILNSTYLRDLMKNDPWWVIWHTELKLSDIYKELTDYSYIKNSYLYKNKPEFKEYADKTIAHFKEKVQEYENLTEHLRLMRQAYEKNIEQMRLFNDRLNEYAEENQVGRLIALIANLELMNARMNLTLNLNRRIVITLLLKHDIWGMVNQNRDMNRGDWQDEE